MDLENLTVCVDDGFSFRHSRFGGSYVVQGLKSIGDNDVIYHRNLNNVSHELLNLTFSGPSKNNLDCIDLHFPLFHSSKITLMTQEKQ